MVSTPSPAPRVTVIIIFLNEEAFITAAIESVRAQTLGGWELILVDDGSTDGSTAIAKDYAAAEPERIGYIEHSGHENRGMSASRNAGLRIARGEYVAFLDADDLWLPRRLEVHLNILEADPEISLVMGRTRIWHSWRKGRGAGPDLITELGLPVGRVLAPPIVAIGFLEANFGNLPGICGVTSRTEDLLAAGGFEDAFRTLYEDQVFFFKMCLRYNVYAVDDVLDCYRQHADSACNRADQGSGRGPLRFTFLDWLHNHLIDGGFKSRRLWRAMRAQMLAYDRPRLFWWVSLPRRLADGINVNLRPIIVRILTPEGYNLLRRKVRLGLADIDRLS